MTQKLMTRFKALTDPGVESVRSYPLEAILLQTIVAVASDADTWVAIEESGKAKRSWSETCVALPDGTPSCDTLGDLFKRLDPAEFEQAFVSGLLPKKILYHKP